jgi:hypothetical protein
MVPTWAGVAPERAPFPPPASCFANIAYYHQTLRSNGFDIGDIGDIGNIHDIRDKVPGMQMQEKDEL